MLLTAYFSHSFRVMIAPQHFSNHLTALITEYCDPNCVLCPFSLLSLHSVSLVLRGLAEEPFLLLCKSKCQRPCFGNVPGLHFLLALGLMTLNFRHIGLAWSGVVYISHAGITSLTLMQIHQHKIGVTPAPLKSMELRQQKSNVTPSILCCWDFIGFNGGEAALCCWDSDSTWALFCFLFVVTQPYQKFFFSSASGSAVE